MKLDANLDIAETYDYCCKLHVILELGYVKDSNAAAHSVDTGIS